MGALLWFDLVAGLLGLALAAALLVRWRDPSRRYLGLAALALAMPVIMAPLGPWRVYEQVPHLIRLADPFLLLLGPSLYLYALAAARLPIKHDWLHYTPFAIYLVVLIPFYALPGEMKVVLLDQAVLGESTSVRLTTYLLVRSLHMLLYSVLAFGLIRRFDRALHAQYSNLDQRGVQRSVPLLGGFMATTALVMGIYGAAAFQSAHLLTANAFVAAVFSLGIIAMAFMCSGRWEGSSLPTTLTTVENASIDLREQRHAHLRMRPKVPKALAASLAERLRTTLEEEKAYLDSDLTLAQLSERLDARSYQVSEVLNRHYQASFFDVVNRLRVQEVKRRLADPAYAHWSVLGIAMETGFNTKSSFNTAFRKHAGTTPSAYRREHELQEGPTS